MLVLAMLTVFLAGLMVGRTPEYLGKKIGRREVTFVALYMLAMPTVVLVGSGDRRPAPARPRRASPKAGPHGLSEILYAYASAANNNGSAFAGFRANTDYQNTALGLAMLLGRFVPIVLVLALAGRSRSQRRVPRAPGTLPTHRPGVRRPAGLGGPHRRRPHLRARPVPRSRSWSPCNEHRSPSSSRPRSPPPPIARSPGAAPAAPARRRAQARPAHQWDSP